MKKSMGTIIERVIRTHGLSESAEVIDYIKALGFKYSTLAGITFSMDDVQVPAAKKDLLSESDQKVETIRKQYARGLITDEERYNAVINVWENTTKQVSTAMEENFDELNPIYMMVKSGARGNMNQLRQIAGIRGLMASTTGKAVEIPIKSSFAEGLDALEYFISAHGARKGLSDTALRTADSGYLTRRLVDVSQDIIVREDDCGTQDGILIYDIKDGNQIIEKMQERLLRKICNRRRNKSRNQRTNSRQRHNDYRKYSRQNSRSRNRKTKSTFSIRMSFKTWCMSKMLWNGISKT